jgi:hypothetical protein
MIKKIISGGQTGTDEAALFVAKKLGIETGGFAPLGYRTTAGSHMALKYVYGLVETEKTNYQHRTKLNVMNSDGTLRIACDFTSPGELLTINLCNELHKPVFDIYVSVSDKYRNKTNCENVWTYSSDCVIDLNSQIKDDFWHWVDYHNIETLNVAGNSNVTVPHMYNYAATVMERLMQKE